MDFFNGRMGPSEHGGSSHTGATGAVNVGGGATRRFFELLNQRRASRSTAAAPTLGRKEPSEHSGSSHTGATEAVNVGGGATRRSSVSL